MKKLFSIALAAVLILITSCAVLFRPSFYSGQYSYQAYANGYWSQQWSNSDNGRIQFYKSANSGEFILHNYDKHPSNYNLKVSYNFYTERKIDDWYIYDGTIEYFVAKPTDKFPYTQLDNYSFEVNFAGGDNVYKKTSPALIKIQKIKASDAHNGATFNVWFEGIAIGISGIN